MDLIRKVIREEINRLISEGDHNDKKFKRKNKEHHHTQEDHDLYVSILKKLKAKPENQDKPEELIKKMAKKEFNKEKFGDRMDRTRKLTGGRTMRYNLKDWQREQGSISDADAEQLRTSIDQENTDIAAVARKVFPHHTDEGAQSQLRKILNGERKMTKRVFNKLSRMVASGQIAVKTS